MSEITVASVGDIMMVKRPATWRRDTFPATFLAAADLRLGNLEAPVSDRGWRQDKIIALRTPTDAAPDLKEMGFDVVSFANNHALDYGYDALFDTLELVNAQGVKVVGAGSSLDEAMAPVISTVRGRTVATFGFCSAIPSGAAAAADRPGLAPIRVKQTIEADSAVADEQPGTSPYVHTSALQEDVDRACALVAKAKAAGHLVLIQMHWGVPPGWAAAFQGWLADYQQPLGHALIDAGADAIFGHHAHVIHGTEMYKGRPIFYSLGNFLFHTKGSSNPSFQIGRPTPPWRLGYMKSPDQRESFVVSTRFGAEGFVEAHVRPILLDSVHAEPTEAPADVARAIMARFADMSQQVGTAVELQDDGTWAIIKA